MTTRLAKCLPWPIMIVAVIWLAGGCGPAPVPTPPAAQPVAEHDDHDHDGDHDHDHAHDKDDAQPDTIEAGLAELGTVIEAAKKALADKNLDDADNHVHMVGHLVDDLHGLVSRAKLPAETEAAAKKALDELYECFDDLDTKLHAADEEIRKGIDYAMHEPRVTAALEALRDLATPVKAAVEDVKKDVDE